jgi:hypothetical protein
MGRPRLNLEPTSGLCLKCLTDRAVERRASQRAAKAAATAEQPAMGFDARAAAARNDA